jgi:hypothetical protein
MSKIIKCFLLEYLTNKRNQEQTCYVTYPMYMYQYPYCYQHGCNNDYYYNSFCNYSTQYFSNKSSNKINESNEKVAINNNNKKKDHIHKSKSIPLISEESKSKILTQTSDNNDHLLKLKLSIKLKFNLQ